MKTSSSDEGGWVEAGNGFRGGGLFGAVVPAAHHGTDGESPIVPKRFFLKREIRSSKVSTIVHGILSLPAQHSHPLRTCRKPRPRIFLHAYPRTKISHSARPLKVLHPYSS